MKNRTVAALAIIAILSAACFIDVSTATSQTQTLVQASGAISQSVSPAASVKPQFLIRCVWIDSLTSPSAVDAYVAAHPWGTGIIMTDYSSGILSVISYTGWNASQSWEGPYGKITYAQLKSVIDEFHRLGWKVIYSPGNTPTTSDAYIYNYLTLQHPELIAVSGSGVRYDQLHPGTVMVNFWADYATPDPARNIPAGACLATLYVQRLSQMISDGSFQWDGWFGIDGWNGLTNQAMYWVWSTNQPFGRLIGTGSLSDWFYGDGQSIASWASSSYAVGLPSNWASYTTSQKISWITTNDNLQWWQYWQTRFAQLYAQINQIFNSRPSSFYVGTIISQDLSSTWADNGINNPTGMENLTMFAQYNSFSLYYIDCEWWGDLSMLGRYSAYVSALVKDKDPSAHCICGLPLAYGGSSVMPTWAWKQMYLSMIETYVWVNGVQYRAVDPDWLLVWAPSGTSWSDSAYSGQAMATWVTTMANTLNGQITPSWLGPVDVQPVYLNPDSAGPFSVNFTIAQYTDAVNLNNTGSNFVSGMGTVFLDACENSGSTIGGNAYQSLLNLYSKGSLNVIFSSERYQANFANTMFMGQGNAQCMSTLQLTGDLGSSTSATTLSSSQVTNSYAKAIIGNTFGQAYSGYSNAGSMGATAGMIPLVKYSDGSLELGIYYSGSSGRFVYGNCWGSASSIVDDRGMLNRAIYWASNCPVSCSNSLADLKVFTLANGKIGVSIMNLQNFSQNMPLTLNLTGLGLSSNRSHAATWASSGQQINITSLSNVQVTLTGGADVLIISP
ncbi:MAG: hypothetical protein ABSG33_05160 [Candidatus Bathyarchaeia archaeon]|jgi:hypothetical protein